NGIVPNTRAEHDHTRRGQLPTKGLARKAAQSGNIMALAKHGKQTFPIVEMIGRIDTALNSHMTQRSHRVSAMRLAYELTHGFVRSDEKVMVVWAYGLKTRLQY